MMLNVTNLRKTFDRSRGPALDGVSFSVKEGEIFGLLGHNGAGKSTALGIILGLVHPDGGSVEIDGVPVLTRRGEAMKRVGAIFESPSFYDYLSGWKNLRVITALSSIPDPARLRETVDLVGLAGRIHDRVRTYSHGMRQRLGIAQALLPNPRLLFFDEPTNGLDPDGIRDLRILLKRLRDEMGFTIVFNSHLLSEVEQICDRFAILRRGKLVFEGSQADLSGPDGQWRLDADPRETAASVLAAHGGSWSSDTMASLPLNADPARLVADLVRAGVSVMEISPHRRSLEDLYLEIAERNQG